MQAMNGTEFAEFCGVSKASISGWAKDGMPCSPAGRAGRELRIDPAQAIPWVIAHREAPEGSQRERLARVQADKVEIDNATKRGQLIYAYQAADSMNSVAANLSAELDALSGRLANELAGISDAGEIRTRILRETRSIRASVARHVGQLAQAGEAAADDGDDMEPAAGEEPGPVGGRSKGVATRKRGARAVAEQ
jgi:phage terminase Nu1 subunit (DNA packaging protein)